MYVCIRVDNLFHTILFHRHTYIRGYPFKWQGRSPSSHRPLRACRFFFFIPLFFIFDQLHFLSRVVNSIG